MADQIGAIPLAMPVTPFELNPVLLRVNTGGIFYACIPYASVLTQNEKLTRRSPVVHPDRFSGAKALAK